MLFLLAWKWNLWEKAFSSVKTKTNPNFAVNLLKWTTIHFYCLFENHIFQTSVVIIECKELNWLCKHMKKIRISQPAIPVLNWVKHKSFPVSIVKDTSPKWDLQVAFRWLNFPSCPNFLHLKPFFWLKIHFPHYLVSYMSGKTRIAGQFADLTLFREQISDWHFPDRHFPYRRLLRPNISPLGHFHYRKFLRTNISPLGRFPYWKFPQPDISPLKHFLNQKFPNRIFSWPDISSLGYFPHRIFPRA